MFFKIGKIHKTAPPGVEQCADGSFTDARLPGRCSYHGGLLMKTVRAKKERDRVVLPDAQPEVNQTRCAKKKNALCRDLENKYRQLRAIAVKNDFLITHPEPQKPLRKYAPKGMYLDHLFYKANEGLLRLTGTSQHEERGTENLVIQYLAEIQTVISELLTPKTIEPQVTQPQESSYIRKRHPLEKLHDIMVANKLYLSDSTQVNYGISLLSDEDQKALLRYINNLPGRDIYERQQEAFKQLSNIGKIGQIPYQTSPEQYATYIDNTALATAISLLGTPKWKNLYYRILAKSQNNELALYIIYHLYNRRQMTNIPANYQGQVQNFVFTYNL